MELVSTSGPKSLAHIEYFDKQGINVNSIKERKVMYSGTAREAVKLFPRIGIGKTGFTMPSSNNGVSDCA